MNADSEKARAEREYPKSPIVGVAAVVLHDRDVLLVRRGREPMLGAWSLPGGALELGETTAEGVAREVLEETGLRVEAVEIIATLDRIVRDKDGRVRYHYTLVEWLCRSHGSMVDVVCGDDAAEAIWVRFTEISSPKFGLDATTLGVIERALKLAEITEQ